MNELIAKLNKEFDTLGEYTIESLEDIDFLANIANAEERDPREVAASILHYAIQRLQFTKQTTKDIAREAEMFQAMF